MKPKDAQRVILTHPKYSGYGPWRKIKVGLFLQTDKNFAELSICGIQEESFIQLVIRII